MTTFFLIRHATNDWVGKSIAGRTPGVDLSAVGRDQAMRLVEVLARERIDQIFSSPLERAVQTATPLSKRFGLEIQIADALTEIDFGDWTGKTIEELDLLPIWKQWNLFRSGTRIPNGELIAEVQLRMVQQLESIRVLHPDQRIAIFSHGDPIKAALFYYLGLPVDLFQRVEISPASISVLQVNDYEAQIVRLNDATAAKAER